MTESAYLDEVRGLPHPSDEQIASFADYLRTAHSWYKHLPFLAPGVPFVFYLDPNAGRDKIITDAGLVYRERTPDVPERERFHYTWQPTADYLRRFGHLEYYAEAGTSFLVGRSGGALTTEAVPEIQGRDGGSIAVPQPIHDAGTAFLTSAIHPLGSAQVALDTHATRRRIPTAELVGRFVQFAYEVGASDLRTQDEELQLRRACRRWIKGVRRTRKYFKWPPPTWLKPEWVEAAGERQRFHTIPSGERDRDLTLKLSDELAGILAWAVEGCLRWQKDGLGEPEVVRAATRDYQEEMDVLADFFADRCEFRPDALTEGSELYAAYKEWCNDTDERECMSRNAFGSRLVERGYARRKPSKSRRVHYVGIEVRKELKPSFAKVPYENQTRKEPERRLQEASVASQSNVDSHG